MVWCCRGTTRCGAEQVSMLDIFGGRMILGLGPAPQGRVRRLPARHGRQRELFVEYGGRSCRSRDRRDGISRQAFQSSPPPPSAPRRTNPSAAALCRGGESRERAHHGQARRRPPDHSRRSRGARSRRSSPIHTLYRELNGTDAPQPISAGWTFVDRAPNGRARWREIYGGYYRTVLDHTSSPART